MINIETFLQILQKCFVLYWKTVLDGNIVMCFIVKHHFEMYAFDFRFVKTFCFKKCIDIFSIQYYHVCIKILFY